MDLKVEVTKIDPFSIDPAELKNLDFSSEVSNIKDEIKAFFSSETAEEMKQSDLYSRISQIISMLNDAENNLKARREIKKLQAAAKELKIQLGGYHEGTGTENLEETKAALELANQQLEQAKADLKVKVVNAQLKLALMEGYSTVNLMRAYFFGEIEYKILSIGKYSGEDVILEAHPTLEDLYKSVTLENSARGGIGLKITETAKQFERSMKILENSESQLTMANSVLNQMSRVQLNERDRNMWKVFVDLKERLDGIKGARVNFGNMAESFVTYQLEDIEMTVDNVYELLEKGRNNLAYYLGADVDNFQVKALTTYGKTGRADIATLSNVINPLKELADIILHGVNPAEVKQTIEEFFTPHDGQGDRPFKDEVSEKVRKEIEGALKDISPS